MKLTTIGIDLAKNVFQVEERGQAQLRRKERKGPRWKKGARLNRKERGQAQLNLKKGARLNLGKKGARLN